PEPLRLAHRATHAAQLRFDRVRYEEATVELRWTVGVAITDRVLPRPIEILPALANHLRPRILGQGMFAGDLRCPAGSECRQAVLCSSARGEHEQRNHTGAIVDACWHWTHLAVMVSRPNTNTVRDVNSSPGRRIVDGNCGLLGESG